MPIGDWQFWVVTLAFVGAGVYLLRGVIPGLKGRHQRAARQRRATLTVDGKPVGKSRK